MIDSEVYKIKIDLSLDFLQRLESVYYDNWGKIKIYQQKIIGACGFGKDVIILSGEFCASFNSYVFDYQKGEYVHRAHIKLRSRNKKVGSPNRISKIAVDIVSSDIIYLSVNGYIHMMTKEEVLQQKIMRSRTMEAASSAAVAFNISSHPVLDFV